LGALRTGWVIKGFKNIFIRLHGHNMVACLATSMNRRSCK
jgi:hypothetical protein